MMKRTGLVLGGLALAGLTGCVGGSDSGAGSSYSGSRERIELATAEDGKSATSKALGTAQSMDAGKITTGIGKAGAADGVSLVGLTNSLVSVVFAERPETRAARVSQSNTKQCAYGGSYTVTANIQGSQLSAGDSGTIVYNECRESASTVTTGTVSLTFNKLSGSAMQGDLDTSISARFNAYRTSNSSGYKETNGDVTVVAHYGVNGRNINGMSGSSVVISSATESVELSSFDLYVGQDTTTRDFFFSYDFVYASTALGGSIAFDTTAEFQISENARWMGGEPTAGQAIISGARDGKVRMTAQPDGTNVFIEYDLNPIDGVYESSETVTWASL